jgi:hypothetical protein
VEQDHGTIAQFGSPRFEVVTDSIIGMQAIDVKEINATVSEMFDRLVEGRADKSGKHRVPGLMVGGKSLVHLLPIQTGLLVTRPGVDSVAERRQT